MSEDVCSLLHELFLRSARRIPAFPAVEWEKESLTYSELDTCSDAVAGWISRQGAASGAIVALLQDRGLEMLVAIIGVLRAGKAYMPLLTTWPVRQQHSILEETECRCLISQSEFREMFISFSGVKLELDDCRAFAQSEAAPADRAIVLPTDLAYIIYTSGSTGKPKGVLMHHAGTAANIARNAPLSCGQGTRCCFSNSYTFDVHVADIFKPLSQGGIVVVTRDIFRIPPVDLVSTLPSRLSKAHVPQALKTIIFNGEGLTPDSVKPIPQTTTLLNIYGATEFFDATMKAVDLAQCPVNLKNIGKPLGDYVKLWVMDPDSKELKPALEAGEMVVGGIQVCRGYIKRPEQDKYKFFRAPWLADQVGSHDRVYRTGDLVRLCEDGEYEHLGRVEQQVKLNGRRIDLAAMESQMMAIDGIVEAAVVVHGTGTETSAQQQLVVYVSPSSATTLVGALGPSVLPDADGVHVVGVDEWPRTSSGKIDRKRLRDPRLSAFPGLRGPKNGLADALAEPNESGDRIKPKPVRRRWIFHDPVPEKSCVAGTAAPLDDTLPLQCTATGAPKDFTACQRFAELSVEAASLQSSGLVHLMQVEAYRRGCVFFNKPLPVPAEVAPMALLPSPVPYESFAEVQGLAPIFSRLIDRVASDVPWLMAQLAPLRSVDPWMARLLELADSVYGPTGVAKDPQAETRLILSRQDYLPHNDGRYLQVEINTIAVAFAGLTSQVTKIHADALRTHCPELSEHGGTLTGNLPGADYARAIAAAHADYIATSPTPPGKGAATASVCFYCFHDDHLEMDQRHIEADLERLGVPCIRAVLGARMELRDGVGGKLFVNGTEVSVLYFHCTYCPEHFSTEVDWENRRLIELSSTVKVPSLLAHLAGSKRVQQVLSDEAVLSRFLPQDEVSRCMAVFARQVDPSCSDNAKVVAEALAAPDRWVLKPQREGGGNNLYHSELAATLSAAKDLEQYVLMEKICSPPTKAIFLQSGAVEEVDAIAELGVFAAYLKRGRRRAGLSDSCPDSRQELINTASGAMLRTKRASSEEGGVCAGFGVLDDPFVVSSGCRLPCENSKSIASTQSTSPSPAPSSPRMSTSVPSTCPPTPEIPTVNLAWDIAPSVTGPPYRWLPVECNCQFLENLYVRPVNAYFKMPRPDATDEEFWIANDTCAQYDEQTRAEIIRTVRNELGRRSAIPKLFSRNLALACKRYRPLHQELFLAPEGGLRLPLSPSSLGVERSQIFRPEFVSIWESIQAGVETSPEHLKPVHEGAYEFPLLSRDFCRKLSEELKHFKSQGLPHQQPNSMNRQGCILNEIGFGPLMDRLMMYYIGPVCRALFPDMLPEGMDSHHSFVVKYKLGQDTSLGVHDDNSEVTLNIALCDADQYTGGRLALYHRERCEHPQQLKLGPPYIHAVGTGTALVHAGDLLHEVLPLSGGERFAMVSWLRSDTYRRSHGCPLCGRTDRFLHA